MKKAGMRTGLVGLLVVAFVAAPLAAHAYTYANYCEQGLPQWVGFAFKWSGGFRLYRDRCSMNDQASHDSHEAAAYAWNTAMGISMIDPTFWYDSGCVISHGNGRSEVARVSAATLGSGRLGLTIYGMSQNTCFTAAPRIPEADVMVRDDLAFGNPDESFWNYNQLAAGRDVLLHEFGHALGLGHSEGFDIMRSSVPLPRMGGANVSPFTASSSQPFPDDIAGVRDLYGLSASQTNLFASGQKFANNQITRTDTNPLDTAINKCAGQSLPITITVGNNGNQPISSASLRIFIDPTGTGTGGTTVWSGTVYNLPAGNCTAATGGDCPDITNSVTGNARRYGSYFTGAVNVTIPPGTPQGFYWIYWKVDSSNSISEYNEGDNAVHSSNSINIGC